MSPRLFDHIDLRVSSVERARAFYHAFLPAVGFTDHRGGEDWLSYSAPTVSGEPTAPFVWIVEEPDHRPNANRIALWAETEEEVNRLGLIVRNAGARAIEGPEYCHDYTPGYYAVFFEDADGNKWEICCRHARVREGSDAESAA